MRESLSMETRCEIFHTGTRLFLWFYCSRLEERVAKDPVGFSCPVKVPDTPLPFLCTDQILKKCRIPYPFNHCNEGISGESF